MCGSRPLPDAVTRSTGTGAVFSGTAARRASTRAWTAFTRSGLVGLRFEPADEPALYGNGVVADGRPQKYLGSSNGWPISDEPTTLPSFTMRLPFAWRGKTTFAMPVTTSGYTPPVMTVKAKSMTSAGRRCDGLLYTRPRATRVILTSF